MFYLSEKPTSSPVCFSNWETAAVISVIDLTISHISRIALSLQHAIEADNVETRDNGSIIMLEPKKSHT